MDNKEEIIEKSDSVESIKIIDTTEAAEVENSDNSGIKKPFLKEIYSYLILIAIAFIAAQIIHLYIFTPVTVNGHSMKPNLENGDILFLSRFDNYERFDVIVFKAPDTDYYIKRLIGLPGDYVKMENDQLYINDILYEEQYLDYGKTNFRYSNTFTPNFTLEELCFEKISEFTEVSLSCNINGKVQIPEGYYLVLGDNRPYSNDSTELGLISETRLMGEAKFVMFPFKRFGKIKAD